MSEDIMRHAGRVALSLLLVVGACTDGTSPNAPSRNRDGIKQQRLHANQAGIQQGGNNFYQVFVLDVAAAGIGQYTVMTGPNHPVTLSTGSPKNVLFGNGSPGTTYNTIHSYTTGTDYVAVSGVSGPGIVPLDPSQPGITATVTALGSTGFRTTYTLAGPPSTPDALTIVQDVNTHGTTFETSTVEVTTTITNNGSSSVSLGLRYLWDTQIGQDDGPTFQQLSPEAPVIVTERSFPSPSFGFYRIQDNDGNPTSPLFSVFGTVTGPSSITPAPTAPDLLDHADWNNSVEVPFAYTVNPSMDVSTNNGTNDDAVLYYWGPTQATAIALAAGASRTFSQSLVSAEANAPPPFNQPPTAHITAPATGASFAQGASVSFAGNATDPEDGTLTGASLVWTSSIGGQIGTGTSFSTTSLAVGTHTITLTATDTDGATGTATITVGITGVGANQAPTAQITSPPNNGVFAPGSSVSFAGTGTDPEDGTLTGASLVWTDNVAGQIGTGTSFSLTTLTPGVHIITLTATDSQGSTGTATDTITMGFSQRIGPEGGSLCVEACHLSLFVPAGALTTSTLLIEWPVANPPSPPAGIVGGAHNIAPAGLTFATNGALGIGYDPATLPSGISESSLRLYQFVGGSWQLIGNSDVNLTTHIVFAQVGGTGLFAIVGTP
jgi:hypothetical protein